LSLEPVKKRIVDLSAAVGKAEDAEKERLRRFFAKLNIDELKRLRDIRNRLDAGQPPTAEEQEWIESLRSR